jgi:hypothetical protein
MKKLLALALLCVAATLSSCDKQKQLTRRLDGTWDISNVKYKATITVPPGLEVPLEGTATNGGYFTFDKKTLRNDFKISFNTETTQLLGQTVPSLPINIEQTNNTWRNTIDSLFINGTGTTTTNYQYAILKNEKKTQQWASKFELTDIPSIPGSTIQISKVEVEFTFDMTKRK